MATPDIQIIGKFMAINYIKTVFFRILQWLRMF
jgi:hypothetical protein